MTETTTSLAELATSLAQTTGAAAAATTPVEEEEAETRAIPAGADGSQYFPGLSKEEGALVWAGIVVAVLVVGAILLRFTMPLLRKKRGKKGKGMTSSVSGSCGRLFDSPSPSSASRSSTWSRGSNTKARDSDASTSVTTISGSRDWEKGLRDGQFTLPAMYLPRGKSVGHGQGTSSSQQKILNDHLTNVLSTPQLKRLESLNLSDTYRNNWDRTFVPHIPHSDSLSQYGHPSEYTHPAYTGRLHVHQPASRSSPKPSLRSHPELKTHL